MKILIQSPSVIGIHLMTLSYRNSEPISPHSLFLTSYYYSPIKYHVKYSNNKNRSASKYTWTIQRDESESVYLKRKRNGNEGKRKIRPVGELVCVEDRILSSQQSLNHNWLTSGVTLQLASRDLREYGQSDTNARGESLLEYLVGGGGDFLVLNRSKGPTKIDWKAEVIVFTLLKIATK